MKRVLILLCMQAAKKMIKGEIMDIRLRNMTGIYLCRGDSLLLLYRVGSRVIANSYTASAGGHFEKEELNDARACVLRELYEETGLTERDIENPALRYVTLRLKNGEIRQNYYFFADLKDSENAVVSNEGSLKWFKMEYLLNNMPEMPFSSYYVVKHYIEVGKDTDALYVGAATEDGVTFTEIKEF